MKICGPDDFEFVASIVKHETVLPLLIDDGSKECDVDEAIRTILTSRNWLVLAPNEYFIVVLQQRNSIAWEIHFQLLPAGRGNAVAAGKEAVRWMFEKTPCLKLMGSPSAENQRAIRYGAKLGMVEHGVMTKAWLKDGRLTDLLITGQCKEDWELREEK